jgi:hypothetical protein
VLKHRCDIAFRNTKAIVDVRASSLLINITFSNILHTVGSYSFVCNVFYARDPRETRIYCQHYSREYKNQASINQQRIRIATQ